jgi:hypothetical protein
MVSYVVEPSWRVMLGCYCLEPRHSAGIEIKKIFPDVRVKTDDEVSVIAREKTHESVY